MDMIRIEPNMLRGTVQVPPSKSVAHRAMIAAALSGKPCRIHNVAMSKDICATLSCLKSLGIEVCAEEEKNEVYITGKQKKRLPETLTFDCGESGSTLRFFMPLSLLTGKKVRFTGQGRLMQRPQKPYQDLFIQKGISYINHQESIELFGDLQPGLFQLPGNVSSQFITGLLYALPLLDGDSEIQVTTLLESRGYVDLTLQVLEEFGIEIHHDHYRRFVIRGGQNYQPKDYTVEGDYSQAAFFLVADALGCDIAVSGLNPDSLQGDKKILDIIRTTGAEIQTMEDGSLKVRRVEHMRGFQADAREIPDLVPILAVLASFCQGESLIHGAGRLRLKESDRLESTASELRQMGIDIFEGADFLRIQGTSVAHSTTVSSWNDHRIAMATAIAACRAEGPVTICGAKSAVTKSYPDFFEIYQNLSVGPRTLLGGKDIITEEKL